MPRKSAKCRMQPSGCKILQYLHVKSAVQNGTPNVCPIADNEGTLPLRSVVWWSLCETTCAFVRVSRVQLNGTICVSYRKVFLMRTLGPTRHRHHLFELADVQPPYVRPRLNCCCRKLYRRIDTITVISFGIPQFSFHAPACLRFKFPQQHAKNVTLSIHLG